MTPTSAMLAAAAAAIATDTAWLAAAGKVNLHLAKAPFTPGPNLGLGDLDEATFVGYAALAAGSATVQVYTDPLTGSIVLQTSEPLGGWYFHCTGTTGLPETISGYYLTDPTNATLIDAALFDEPIMIINSGQAVNVPQVQLRMSPTSLF